MVDMRALSRRYAEVKQAEVDRNNLLDELFQKVDDMQKTMDRNAFIMVLIDGDCMNVRSALQFSHIEQPLSSTVYLMRPTIHTVFERAGQARSVWWRPSREATQTSCH